MTIQIHPELQSFFRPLSAEELATLEVMVLREGMTEPLYLWKGHNVLLDGHHRYRLCQKHDLPYTTTEIEAEDLDAAKLWMIKHQGGRRQWTEREIDYYMGMRYELEKKQGQRRDVTCGQSDHKFSRTAHVIAHEHQVSEKTVRRNATFAQAVNTITTALSPAVRPAIIGPEAKIARQDVQHLATIAHASPQSAQHVLEAVHAAPTPKAATQVIRAAAKRLPRPGATAAATPARWIETIPTADGRQLFIVHDLDSTPVFNRTNELVGWATYTWNPVTGCWVGCDFCYARGIANDARLAASYPKQFEPTFHPARLQAPTNTTPPSPLTRPEDRNVFTCSMADLFAPWIPEEWILQVLAQVQRHPEWHFLFLTKCPQRLPEIGAALGGFPPNAWIGCTVDTQARVATAEKAFRTITAQVRWLSVEPMRERLTFQALDLFDWIVIGGQTASEFNNTPAFQPAWEWVEHLWQQARAAGAKVYWKDNLTIRPQEVPWTQTTP